MTQDEQDALQKKIDLQTAYQAKTPIQKIISDYQAKVDDINDDIALKQKAIDSETTLINDLYAQKQTLEANRSNTLRINHDTEKKQMQEMIEALQKYNLVKS